MRLTISNRGHRTMFRLALGRPLVVLLFFWFSRAASAQSEFDPSAQPCADSVVTQVGAYFKLANFAFPRGDSYPSVENGGLIVAGVCVPWPSDRSKTIAAFAYDDGTENEKQLLLAIVDVGRDRVVAFLRSVIPEDASTEVTRYSLRLDIAPYQLSKDTRAFGLRLNTFRGRCGYAGSFGDELTLFVVSGQSIRPVLTETMSRSSFGPGNRCGGEEVAQIDTSVVISVEPSSSNGYADLRLTARRSDHKKPLSVVVKYKRDQYDLKDWSSAFAGWLE